MARDIACDRDSDVLSKLRKLCQEFGIIGRRGAELVPAPVDGKQRVNLLRQPLMLRPDSELVAHEPRGLVLLLHQTSVFIAERRDTMPRQAGQQRRHDDSDSVHCHTSLI